MLYIDLKLLDSICRLICSFWKNIVCTWCCYCLLTFSLKGIFLILFQFTHSMNSVFTITLNGPNKYVKQHNWFENVLHITFQYKYCHSFIIKHFWTNKNCTKALLNYHGTLQLLVFLVVCLLFYVNPKKSKIIQTIIFKYWIWLFKWPQNIS